VPYTQNCTYTFTNAYSTYGVKAFTTDKKFKIRFYQNDGTDASVLSGQLSPENWNVLKDNSLSRENLSGWKHREGYKFLGWNI
jgi:hypothetical protein